MIELPRDVRYAVVVSDLHIGSTLAMSPPRGVRSDEGQHIAPSAEQRALWAYWRLFWDKFVPDTTRGDPYVVIVNGDAIEGDHHDTWQIWSQDPKRHVRAAAQILKPELAKAAAWFMVRGTEAHVGTSASCEEELARTLLGRGSIDDATPGDDDWEPVTHWDLWLQADPWRLNVAHHIGCTSSAAYEHSALSRELAAGFVEAARWGDDYADFTVRSHRHMSSSVSIPTARGQATVFVTPGWQLKTAHVYRVGTQVRRPQLGGVVIHWDDFGIHGIPWVKAWPRDGKIPLTPRAARRLTTTGRSSANGSGSRKTPTAKRPAK